MGSRPWRAMRCPATGLSNPPLSRSTPRPTTSSPHVFCVDPARFRLILHAANERAAVGENRQAMALHLGDEDAAGPVGRPEDREAIRDGLHVDRAAVDRIERNGIAPAKGGQDLGAPGTQIFPFAEDAGRTIGATGDPNLLDVRSPSVDHIQGAGRRLPEEQTKGLAGLDRPDHRGRGVEDARGLAGRQAARRRGIWVETTETRGDRRSNRERHSVRCDGPAVHERDVRLDRGLVDQETRLEIVRAIDDDVGIAQDLSDRRRMDVFRDRFDLDFGVHGAEAFRGGLRLRPVDVAFAVEQLPLEIREFDDIPVDEPKMPDPCAGPRHQSPEGLPADGTDSAAARSAKGRATYGLSPAATVANDAEETTSQSKNSFLLAPLNGGDCMDSMVSTAPSAWLAMENALDRLTRDFTILTVLVLILVAVSLLSWFRTGVLDLGFVLALAVLIALRDIGAFCRGAMERMRQLSQMV